MEQSIQKPWAQLVSTTDTVSEPVMITTNKFIIGRSLKDCDLSLNGNKLVSSRHCFIEKDSEGKAWIKDTSTNGTLLNLTNKLSGAKCRLQHGDEIHVVYRRQDDGLNVAYLFQDLSQLEQEQEEEGGTEEEATQEYGHDLDATLPNEDDFPDVVDESPGGIKRKAKETPEVQKPFRPSLKRLRTTGCQQPSHTETPGEREPGMTPGDDQLSTRAMTGEQTPPGDSDQQQASDPVPDTESAHTRQTRPDNTPAVLREDTDKETEETKDASKEKAVASITDSSSQNEAVAGQSAVAAVEPSASKTSAQDEALEDTLTCIICYEIMHDCVSLQPCLHSFCAGCFSGWMEMSIECPSCRMRAERVKKNHILNNLVHVYLSQHPEKKRPEEEIKALEAKNKIKVTMFTPESPERDLSQEIDDAEGYEGYESPEELPDEEEVAEASSSSSKSGYSDTDEDDGGIAPHPYGAVAKKLTPAPVFGVGVVGMGIPRTKCRQCPGAGPATTTGAATTVLGQAAAAVSSVVSTVVGIVKGKPTGTGTISITDGDTSADASQPSTSTDKGMSPSTSSGSDTVTLPSGEVKTLPHAPPYVCKPIQIHLLCQCCLQPMPDRRNDKVTDQYLPAQQCTLCYRIFCHLYWGCRKATCLGCLAKFKEMNFSKQCLASLILDNQYESTIFTQYLESQKMTIKDVLMQCCQKLDSGEFTCLDQTRQFTSNSVVCYPCGLRNLKELAYQLRENIPQGDLPATARDRPNCYWGKNCRTQRNKPHHALKFNHVCHQTRTT